MKNPRKQISGIEADYVLDIKTYTSGKSDVHKFLNNGLTDPKLIIIIISSIIAIILILPFLTFPLFILGTIFLTIHRNNQVYDILFKLPPYIKNWIPVTPIIRKMQQNANGEIFIGNSMDGTNRELWVPRKVEQKHKLNVTGTGGGKTTAIQGSFLTTLGLGGHIVLTEAKGEAKIARMTYNCIADYCQEDDLLFTSYATSNRPKEQGYKGTHCTNIMTGNDVTATTEITVGLLAGQEGSNQIFLERATVLGKLANLLIYEREENSIDGYRATLHEMSDMLNLSNLIKSLTSPWLKKDSIRQQLIAYLKSIQIEETNNLQLKDVPAKSLEQHMFAQIFFTKALSTLTESYGHIFNKVRGDYIWSDIINRKRHIFQLIPAIDKSETELGYVSKVDAQLFLNAVKTFLDPRIQGRAHEISTKLHADLYTQVIKDEYSFQLDQSQPKLVAQLRSLGVSYSVFIQSLKLTHLLDNKVMTAMEKICSSLIVGQTNDEDAREMIIKAGGKTEVIRYKRVEKIDKYSTFEKGYKLTGDGEIEKVDRFSHTDITTQKEGEVHYVILGEKNNLTGGELALRIRLFYMGDKAMEILENRDDIVLNHYVERTDKLRPKKPFKTLQINVKDPINKSKPSNVNVKDNLDPENSNLPDSIDENSEIKIQENETKLVEESPPINLETNIDEMLKKYEQEEILNKSTKTKDTKIVNPEINIKPTVKTKSNIKGNIHSTTNEDIQVNTNESENKVSEVFLTEEEFINALPGKDTDTFENFYDKLNSLIPSKQLRSRPDCIKTFKREISQEFNICMYLYEIFNNHGQESISQKINNLDLSHYSNSSNKSSNNIHSDIEKELGIGELDPMDFLTEVDFDED